MNYPNGLKKQHTNHLITYGNRGMNLESDLNLTNEYYRNIDKAYIYKKPTPIKIVKVDYKSRKLATINEAYFMEPSTTDYNGIYRGKYIDFEAKETKSKTSFSLENIHKHQIRHIKNILNHGGIAFLIIRFSNLNLTYFLDAHDFFSYIEENDRKSIPLDYFKKKGYILEYKLNPRLDYLKVVDKLLEEI